MSESVKDVGVCEGYRSRSIYKYICIHVFKIRQTFLKRHITVQSPEDEHQGYVTCVLKVIRTNVANP